MVQLINIIFISLIATGGLVLLSLIFDFIQNNTDPGIQVTMFTIGSSVIVFALLFVFVAPVRDFFTDRLPDNIRSDIREIEFPQIDLPDIQFPWQDTDRPTPTATATLTLPAPSSTPTPSATATLTPTLTPTATEVLCNAVIVSTSYNVNVRSDASLNARVIRTVTHGASFPIIAVNPTTGRVEWYRITINGAPGWVHHSIVNLDPPNCM